MSFIRTQHSPLSFLIQETKTIIQIEPAASLSLLQYNTSESKTLNSSSSALRLFKHRHRRLFIQLDFMEWYFANDVDDLVVPKNQEPLDRLPSPDSWSQWGRTFGSYESPKKHFNGKSFSDNADISLSDHERERSRNSSVCYDLQDELLQWAPLSHELPDYQLNDVAGIHQTNDIFFSSLLEEDDTCTDDLNGSSNLSAKSNYSNMAADNFLSEMMLDSQYVPSHTFGIGSSNYLQTHAFSPTMEWENEEIVTCPQGKAPVVKACLPCGQASMRGYMDEETSPEESVLQELGRLTSQLTKKTRTCFRDALYRLAENSKQHTANPSQNGDLILEEHVPMMGDDETSRLVKTEATESKTNAIDRAIANLMFHKMHDFSTNDLADSGSLDFEQEVNETTRQHFKCHTNQTQFTVCAHVTSLAGDAEVPIIKQEDPYRYTDF